MGRVKVGKKGERREEEGTVKLAVRFSTWNVMPCAKNEACLPAVTAIFPKSGVAYSTRLSERLAQPKASTQVACLLRTDLTPRTHPDSTLLNSRELP